ncbi:hypothetical protein B0H15DRAFT_910943 [Mycena belliarum]|uniref:BTB domain-containing protein n=1 Tax=Mycena belliarum TaxID=1033014 RepID=A0AAD6XP74_9AGAR|nr:hypothetical protein B0H15DRAFT_910943 [Mycena belliae]
MDSGIQPSGRVQDLWFEDGNLVIQAGTSQFRVYRGILAARSPVFLDMLSFPQPADSELVDGCPVVRLPDAELEVSEFLKALFLPEYFPAFPYSTKFETLVGCLRLSHKYEVGFLRRRALVHLSSGHRTTLSDWDSSLSYYAAAQLKATAPASAISDITSWPKPTTPQYSICAIELAREVDALWVLPAAFYRLSSNITATQWALSNPAPEKATYLGRPTTFSAQDRKALLSGHQTQLTSSAVDILRFLTDPLEIEGCLSPARCTKQRLQAVDGSRDMLEQYPAIPLDIWEEADWKLLDNVCSVCLPVLRRTHRAARQTFWDGLPSLFALPPWEDLERMKTAAIGDNVLFLGSP